MRAPAVSFAQKIAATLAALLTFILVPFAYADGEGIGAEGSEGAFSSGVPTSPQPPSDPSTEAANPGVTLSGAAGGGEVEGSDSRLLTLASGLVGKPGNFINSDVSLDGEPIIGSFTVDGLTFAVTGDSCAELVGVAPSVILSEGSEAAGVEESNSNQASEAGSPNLVLPETVSYEGSKYALTSIAPYAFYLSGVTDVTLPASVNDVDDRAFRSSDVANVTVAEGNPSYSSFDGALYDADQLSLLLIPEGKQGTVRIPKTAEVAEASVFSHCPLVDSISVDAGSAAFASENGLLYTSDLETLLRAPAGATEITIREGCTTIAAGALEACAKLTTINAPASVTSISPDIFHAIPTVSLPIASLAEDAPQLTAMVALSSTDDDLPKTDPSAITVNLPANVSKRLWEASGFTVGEVKLPISDSIQNASTAAVTPSFLMTINPNSGTLTNSNPNSSTTSQLRVTGFFNWAVRKGAITSYRAAQQIGGYYFSIRASRTGYTHTGWTVTYEGKTQTVSEDGQTVSGTSAMTASPTWKVNTYTVSFNINSGTGSKPSDVVATYDSTLPKINSNKPTKTGYTFQGWYDTNAATGGTMYYDANNTAVSGKKWDRADNTTLYARWAAHTYTVTFDSAGGSPASDISATYDNEITLPTPTRQGYAFGGWKDEDTGTIHQAGKTKNLTTADKATVKLVAQWNPVISADVPQTVTARVDLLGIEEQAPATSYIESKCGEPLRVTKVDYARLPGATELFSDRASEVRLEAFANNATTPTFSFALKGSGYLVDSTAFMAFDMAGYGARVPISYRFVIPDDLLASLVETAKPLCAVSYTIDL